MARQRATFTSAEQIMPATEFEALVGHYRPRLYRIALKQVGDPDDAQDALQEALLLAFRHRDQFQGRAQWATWITRIVINAARGQQRRRRARPAESLEVVTAHGREFRDQRPTPESSCLQRERHERLHRLLRRLSPALREAVELRELQGLSCRQAAERLGIPAATLKCRTFRARARLQELGGNA